MKESWGSYFRSDKMLLVILLMIMMGITMVMQFHKHDPENIAWAREQCTGILGAIIMSIRGENKAHNEPPPGTTSQITTQTTVQEAEPEKTS